MVRNSGRRIGGNDCEGKKQKYLIVDPVLAVIGFCEILLMWYEAYTGDLTKIHSSTAGGSKMAAGGIENVKVDAAK